jgi:hypothetical protein
LKSAFEKPVGNESPGDQFLRLISLQAAVAAFLIASQISGGVFPGPYADTNDQPVARALGEPTGGGNCTPNHDRRVICCAVFGAAAQNCFIGAANLSER